MVLMELMAFSMILPILPFLIKDLGGGNLTVTSIAGTFALTSFFFSPFWGSMSDRHGRRVILICLLLLSSLNYIWMAFSHLLWMVLFSRIMSGVFAGWMSVVQSWIADLTDKKNRTAALGMLGATFGVGFAMGPALGGILLDDGVQANITALPFIGPVVGFLINLLPNSHQFPILVAGMITASVAMLGIWILPPNARLSKLNVDDVYITPGKEDMPPRKKFHQKILAVFFSPLWRDGVIGRYLALAFLGQVAFSTLESVFTIWGQANFNYTAKDISYIFATIGVVTIIVQGGLIRPVVKKFGERRVMQIGLVMLAFAFMSLNFFPRQNLVRVIVSIMAVGMSFYQPALTGSLSQNTPADKQGEVLGMAQSLQSLARGLSAIFLGGLFGVLGNNVFLPPAMLFIIAFFLLTSIPKPTAVAGTQA